MKIVRINIDGTMNDLDITLKKKNILKILEEKSSSKGNTNFAELYKWNHEGKEVICYGWYDGEAGFENKHDLIPGGNSSFLCDEDSSEKLLFGDIFLVCYDKKKSLISFVGAPWTLLIYMLKLKKNKTEIDINKLNNE